MDDKLIDIKADIELSNWFLSAAITKNDMNMIKYLIGTLGIDPNINNGHCLVEACKNGNDELAIYLLDNGANPSLSDALMSACENGLRCVVHIMLRDERIKCTQEHLKAAYTSGCVEIVHMMTHKGYLEKVENDMVINLIDKINDVKNSKEIVNVLEFPYSNVSTNDNIFLQKCVNIARFSGSQSHIYNIIGVVLSHNKFRITPYLDQLIKEIKSNAYLISEMECRKLILSFEKPVEGG